MKNPNLCKWGFALSLLAVPLVGGCRQESATNPPRVVTAPALVGAPPVEAAVSAPAVTPATNIANSNAAASTVETPQGEMLVQGTNAVPELDLADAPVTPLMAEKPAPANVALNGQTADIVRLANAGVDETVMLNYVTNSAGTFNLGADQIIYLRDIGVPAEVVTAMLQHDEQFRQQAGSPPPAPEGTAEAQQPSPEQMAPQTAPSTQEVAQAQSGGVYAPPAVDPSYQTFYSSLAPYGTWVELDGYGPVWQPTVVVVNSGWRPYYDGGRWLYTDAGWYWYSDYSWGWAPFHYGRWFHHNRIGWCWTPDYVWGPSWVTWRYSGAYCGWAPLPPAACYRPGFGFSYYGSSVSFNFGWIGRDYYNFVGWNHFYGGRLHHNYRLPPARVNNIYNHTTIVNNYVFQNNTVVNKGIPTKTVAAATKTPVRTVSLRENNYSGRASARPERFDPASKTLNVYRPAIKPTNQGITTALAGSAHRPGAGAAATAGRNPAGTRLTQSSPIPPVNQTRPQPAPVRNENLNRSFAGADRSLSARPKPALPSGQPNWGIAGNVGPRPAPTPSKPEAPAVRNAPNRQTTPPLILRGQQNRPSGGAVRPPAAPTPNNRLAETPGQSVAPRPGSSATSQPGNPWLPAPGQSVPRSMTPSVRPQAPVATTPAPAWTPPATMQAPNSARPQPVPRQQMAPNYRAPREAMGAPRANPSSIPWMAPAPAPRSFPQAPAGGASMRPAPPVSAPSFQSPPTMGRGDFGGGARGGGGGGGRRDR